MFVVVDLGTLITFVTGTMCTDPVTLRRVVGDLVGAPVPPDRLGAALRAVDPHVYRQHPWLGALPAPVGLADEAAVRAYLAPLISRYGDEHQLAPLPESGRPPGLVDDGRVLMVVVVPAAGRWWGPGGCVEPR